MYGVGVVYFFCFSFCHFSFFLLDNLDSSAWIIRNLESSCLARNSFFQLRYRKSLAYCKFLFAFFLLGVASWFGIWSILGITEFYAAHDSLTISYKLLGMFRKISLLTKDIDYFNQFLNESSEGKSWHLEIVTNRRISNKNQSFPAWISKDRVTRINYKTIHIYAHANPSLSEWLGNVLADFYGSRFQSISQPNNPVAHRPNQDSR